MAVRAFDTNDEIRCSLGNAGATDAVTLALLVDLDVDPAGNAILLGTHTSGGALAYYFFVFGSTFKRPRLYNGGAGDVDNGSVDTFTAAMGWCIVTVTKAAGTVVPRFHICPLSSGTTNHLAGTSSMGGTASIAGGTIRFGLRETNQDPLNGKLALAGIWTSDLSDGQVEALATTRATQDWVNLSPQGLWEFNQADTATSVVDLTGGGANQTTLIGTTVVGDSDPNWSFRWPLAELTNAPEVLRVVKPTNRLV